jgi:hypothetical protein
MNKESLEIKSGRQEDPPDEIVNTFGFDPRDIGIRYRSWWIVGALGEAERDAQANIGDLCVMGRDGGSNTPDMSVGRYPNFVGTAQDWFDVTYRYYYFTPLKDNV